MASMSRSVVARVAMSRSASLSNMCSMISYPNGPVQEKGPPGAGLFALLEWSPEVVVAYLLEWVVGYVGRLWSVTLARWFRASAGKRPKAGHFPTRTPPALYPGPHPPYPTRSDKGHPRRSPTAARQRHRRKARPPHIPARRGPRAGTEPRDPTQPTSPPSSPPRHPSREPYQPTDPGPTRPQNRNNAHGLAVDQ